MARLSRLLGVALVASVASLRRLEGECVDDPKWFYSGKSVKNCAYVGAKIKDDGSLARCKESNTDGERSALEACPATCGTCGKAPTPQPTAEATEKLEKLVKSGCSAGSSTLGIAVAERTETWS